MGIFCSLFCKGPLEEEIIEIDECFPLQEKTEPLDWNDVRAVHYRCAANCLHNYALGKIVEKDFPSPKSDAYKVKKERPPIQFANHLQQNIPFVQYWVDGTDDGSEDVYDEALILNTYMDGCDKHTL